MTSPSDPLPRLRQRAWRIRRLAVRMGEVQGQGYVGQALGYADVLRHRHQGTSRPHGTELRCTEQHVGRGDRIRDRAWSRATVPSRGTPAASTRRASTGSVRAAKAPSSAASRRWPSTPGPGACCGRG